MNKYRKEDNITQKYSSSTNTWSFQVRMLLPSGESVCKTFSEKKFGDARTAYDNAKTYRDKIRYQVNSETYIAPCNKTVRELFEEYLSHKRVVKGTEKKLRGIFNKYINSDVPVKNIKKADIEKTLIDASIDSSDDTISRIMSTWRHIYQQGIYMEYIQKDMTYGIQLPPSRKVVEKREVMTDKITLEEIIALCDKLYYPSERISVPQMLWVMYYTGMQPAEVFALSPKDIDLKKRLININKEVGSTEDEMYAIRPPKNRHRNRKIPIVDKLVPILKEALKNSTDELLFPNHNGTYFNSTELSDRLHKIQDGTNFTMYQIRHLFSNNLKSEGNLRGLMDLMGHSNVSTTLGYARSSQSELVDLLNKIE